jgi:hypothetical protein
VLRDRHADELGQVRAPWVQTAVAGPYCSPRGARGGGGRTAHGTGPRTGACGRGASPASSDAKVASLGAPGSMTTAHAYHPPSTPFARCRTRRRTSLDWGTNTQLLTIGLRILQLWSVDECSLQLTSNMVDLLLDGHLVGIIFFLECAAFSHQAARHKEVTPTLLLILPTRPSLISYLVAVDIPSRQ